MALPVWRMKKKEIVWAAKHRCKKHGMPYLEHPNCYFADGGMKQKLGFLDIEATNLKADFGIVLCYCIADDETDTIYKQVITKKDLSDSGELDKNVMKKCIQHMKEFDRLVSYYGTGYDMKFLRTRALALGLDKQTVGEVAGFPEQGEIYHTDVYYVVRNRLCLSRNRMANAAKTVLGFTEKNPIDSEHWIRALQASPKALDYIVDHCERDVRDLKRLYYKIMPYAKETDRSI